MLFNNNHSVMFVKILAVLFSIIVSNLLTYSKQKFALKQINVSIFLL